ncbi:hypothetical protein EG329_008878 [Mollisiaceae sp. DMI_Dod_QoI]|nr:hypothetical protein EG329_008878 [Helotiales sp. DMI_Dod_QoI]
MRLRLLPFIASYFCIPAVILAFHALFAGVPKDGLEAAAIITFNTSGLGLSDYYQSSSTLHTNITALVPSSVIHLSTIAQYLQIKDWYSIHYLSNCSGSFLQNSQNNNFLTSTKTNIECTHRTSGYVYTLSDVLREELNPSVVSLADEITQVSYYTAPWIALWYIGLITAVLEIFLLPLTWFGRRRLNGYSTLLSGVGPSFSCIVSSLTYIPDLVYDFPNLRWLDDRTFVDSVSQPN